MNGFIEFVYSPKLIEYLLVICSFNNNSYTKFYVDVSNQIHQIGGISFNFLAVLVNYLWFLSIDYHQHVLTPKLINNVGVLVIKHRYVQETLY